LRAADRAYLLREGERVAEGDVGAVLTRERLEDLYGASVEKLTDAATGHAAFLPGGSGPELISFSVRTIRSYRFCVRRNLFWLSDEQWQRIEPRLPKFVSRRELRYLLRQARFGHNLANVLDEGCGAERLLSQCHLNSGIQPRMILGREVARSDD